MAAEDYVGPPGKEKKFHKSHFQVSKTLKLKSKNPPRNEWVQIAPGRFVLRKVNHGKEKDS
jgi:hypothetical protein